MIDESHWNYSCNPCDYTETIFLVFVSDLKLCLYFYTLATVLANFFKRLENKVHKLDSKIHREHRLESIML